MNAEEIRREIGGSWTQRADGWWLTVEGASIRESARIMRLGEARFVTMVALPEGDDAMRLSWHWEISGALHSVTACFVKGVLIPTIADIYRGADWAERETRDYYAVAFEGRTDTPALMIRNDDKPGVLLRKSGEKL